MKRFISITLALVMLLSFAACNEDADSSIPQETVSLNIEALKDEWQFGKLEFPNGKSVTIPCKVSEFIEQSGLSIGNEKALGDKTLSPKETVTLYIVGDGMSFKATARNTGLEPDMPYKDAKVVEYNFNNTNEMNRQIKFAGTLTPGVTRKAVEKALGVPKGQKSEDTLYYYTDKNEAGKKVRLIISFNSDDIVNSVAYEIVY